MTEKNEYRHKEVEQKWAKRWFENNLYRAEDFSDKPKKYVLAEFPYPSGKALHAGHMMRYTVPDVYARYLRMQGFNVLFPMGWDAFGLPAENYAVKTGIHPEKTTQEAISNYKSSIKKMGYGIDWEREINTTDPKYYKWTQWLFLNFWEEGLAELKEMPIWWCEKLRTVLSDEEVLTTKEGEKISERGEHPVEKKMLKQWVLKITEYAEKLIEGLEETDFPEAIKQAQINWIGKKEGVRISFALEGEKLESTSIDVFTTRPDTLYGVTFIVLAPEHELVKSLAKASENSGEIENYLKKASDKSDLERKAQKDKNGIKVKGIFAKHPMPEIDKKIPIFIADYVLTDFGTGAVMGVPAHDQRDFEFAEKYELKIIPVIQPEEFQPESNQAYEGEGLLINSKEFNGVSSIEARAQIISKIVNLNKGKEETTYKLRDWIFSRQRYWGEPIPLIHKQDGNIEPICKTDDEECVKKKLPLELPEVPDYTPSADGLSPLEKNKKWVDTTDSEGNPAKRETNTMPNWAGSCWYYIRYVDPQNDKEFADKKKMEYWLPVDKYFGGAEHTTMHLLYSRFWHNFFYDQGLVPTSEPYQWRMNGGLLLGPDGTKMSKSKGNVISPMNIVQDFGADALRAYICFLGPYTDTYPWNNNGVKATYRLANTIYDLKDRISAGYSPSEELNRNYHRLIKNVTEMFEELKMNTAVSEIMIFVNEIKNEEKISSDMWRGFLKVLAPIMPFLAEELWQETLKTDKWNKKSSVHLQEWPSFDEELAKKDTFQIGIQINGKIRDDIEVERNESEDSVRNRALEKKNVKRYLENREIKKFIYVPNKIISIVTSKKNT